MARECPACGAMSEKIWRCEECGKPFHGDNSGAPGRAQEDR